MKKTVISLLSMAFAAMLFADTTFPMSVDFAQGAGDLNSALHGAHLIPPIKDHATQDDTDIKALGLYSVRNHDHALLDTNQRVFDLPLVYPLAQLDPTADASYVFPPTDELVNTVTQTIGTDLLYRLGVSTEESGEEHFNAEIPADFDNTAAAMSHIVARYKDKVTYWEIWNNPASTAYWWKDGYSDAQRKEAFVSFFTTALAKIKTDHPTVKAGGPSIMLPDTDGWIDAIIAGCKAASIKPDFISYQSVSTDTASIIASVAAMRTKLDAAGWSDVELILTEWRHIPGQDGTYQNLDAASMQAACFGTDGVMTTSSALKNLSVMAGLQYAGGLSRAYFKMSMLRSPWSWANWSSNDSRSYNKSYYALKLFNEILAGGYMKLVSVQNEGSRTLLAAQNDAGTKGCVLLVDTAAASSGTYVLPMSGLKNVAKDGDVLALTASKNAATASEVINVSDDKIQFFNYAGNCAYLVRFTMTPDAPVEPVTLTDYYKVGSDPDDEVGHNSWVKSCSSTVGWALTQGGAVIADHQVSANGRYIVPNGTVLRSPSNKEGTSGDSYLQQPFGGAELVLRTGGNLYLQSTGKGDGDAAKVEDSGANLVKVPNLIAEGGTILHATSGYCKRLEGAIEVRSAGLVVKQNNSGSNQERSLTIASTITGSGPIILASATVDSAAQYLRFTGDMSGFTGTFQIDSATAGHLKNEDFRITGAFGGTITALPDGFTSVEVNYDGLDAEKGLRVASTTIPTALKTKLTLFGEADFTAANLPLMTFPAGTTVNPAAFTVKYAPTVDGTGVAFENLGTIENDDGSITLVANKPVPPPSVIEIPTGANLAYNGLSQTGVAAGTGCTLSGTFAATAVGNYTATATLDDPDTTKWTDGTTAAKTINWSITKATNGWKTEPSLSKTSWPVNQAPATLNVGAANFGTMTATLNGEPFDLANPVFPTEEGEYTLVITVAGSNDYGELVKEITFTITAAVDSATYYLAGQDGTSASSFFSSSTPGTVGWSETEGGAAIAHEVAAGNNYVIPSGAVLRTAQNDNADTFLGDTLKLAGEIWFKKAGNTVSPVKMVTIPSLIADGGVLNNEKNDVNAFELAGNLEIPEGKTLTVLNQGDTGTTKTRNFKISATTTGSGTLFVSLGGGSTSGTSSTLELAGDWSGFTGQVAAASGKTKLASWTFIISGAFGGAIGEMPDRSSNPNYIINLADNPDGIRIAGTGDALPTCLRYRTCFYGADFANGTDINLLRVPKSVRAALTSKLEFKWAGSYADAIKGMQTGSQSPTAIDVSKISFVDNRDGTETYVYNRTTFYEKLANDTRKIDASSYATGGDYIYQVSEKEYIHVFKDGGTFTPNKDLTDVQVLVVGGGGAGGYASGGGGGAGGLVYQTDVSFTSGADYTVTVGAGGAKKTSSGSGNNGGASSIGDIVAAGGGGGAGKNSAGIAGGSGGGGSGGGRSGGAGTTVLGSAGGAGCAASNDAIGGGGGGAGEVGWVAGTLGPGQTSESVYNAGCGGNGREIGTAILGYAQYFAGGGGGGTAGGVKRYGIGGFGGGGVGGYDVNNVTFQTPGEDGLGGGGGGGAVDWGPTDGKDHNGAAGGKGVVIVRYMVPVDAKITGTITMSGWKEDETPSEPDLTGLTVTPDMAASALLVKYYADADCTQALDGKPILAGTYYVRAEIEKTRQYTAAVSATTVFTIESGEKIVVPIPTVSSFVYDGTPKTCVEAGDGYTVDSASTVTATDAGDYSVTLKLVDPETSQWSDLTSADKVIPWSIAQAENEWTTAAAIDKTEWMQRDTAGVITSPVAIFGTAAATLNGEPWNGEMPTAIGSYTAKWTVAGTANYTGLEAEIAFTILHDFDVNAWSMEPSITKTSWKSTDAEPGVITLPSASFGGGTMVAEISTDGVTFAAWDGTMPTAKGAYTIRWTVAATEDYSGLESSVEFMIDYRYRPTHPFMCLKSGEDEWKGGWKGANTIADAVNLAGQNGTVEVCKDVDVSALLNLTMSVSLCSNKDDKGARYTITVTADSSFGIYNNGKLTLSNIAFNLLPSANISKFASLGIFANNMGGTLEVKDNVEISGKVTGPLIQNVNGNNGTLYAHLVISGGTIKDLTAGSSLISAPGDTSFSVKNLTIENCTVSNGALIAAGSKTLNLSDVTITNNVTTAGAITVGEAGIIKVSGVVIVKDNKVDDDEKNIVPTNATNIELADALGENALVGVSFGSEDAPQFGVYANDAAFDLTTASKFVNDADSMLLAYASDGSLKWPSKEEAENGYTYAENIILGMEQDASGNFSVKPFLRVQDPSEEGLTFAFGNIAPKVDRANITYTIQSAASPTAADDAWQQESNGQMTEESQTGTAKLPEDRAVKYYRVRFTVEPK